MSVQKYLDSKKVKIAELDAQLVQVGRMDFPNGISDIKKCPNCGYDHIEHHASEAWTSCISCNHCDSLILFVHSDRMSGSYSEPAFIYQAKAATG